MVTLYYLLYRPQPWKLNIAILLIKRVVCWRQSWRWIVLKLSVSHVEGGFLLVMLATVQENLSKAIIILLFVRGERVAKCIASWTLRCRTCYGTVTQNNPAAWSSPNYFIGHILLTTNAKRIVDLFVQFSVPLAVVNRL